MLTELSALHFREVIGALKADLAAARDEIGRLQAEKVSRGQSLSEFFALADRVGDAARVIREAQAMMGGAPIPTPGAAPLESQRIKERREWDREHSPTGVPGQTIQILPAVPMSNKGAVVFTPEEQAQRDMMRLEREARDAAALPENIKALMREQSE